MTGNSVRTLYITILSALFVFFDAYALSDDAVNCSMPAGCSAADSCLSVSALSEKVVILCGPELQGRGRGTSGHSAAALYLYNSFSALGLVPYDESFILNFHFGEDSEYMGWNIAGLMPAAGSRVLFREEEPPIVSLVSHTPFIVIGAHYDNPGTIDGRSFPGADFNASGVAVLLAAADNLHRRFPQGLPANILFVAFDAYSDGCIGSENFVRSISKSDLPYPSSSDVLLYIDLEQLGSSEGAGTNYSDYLFCLGIDGLPSFMASAIKTCDRRSLDLLYSYYGSSRLTQMLLRMGDRRNFVEEGVPVLLFTSGVTGNTNRTSDLPSTLDYSLLSRRSAFISDVIAALAVAR